MPVIQGFGTTKKVAKLPCFIVKTPTRNDDFIGREDILAELDEFLLPKGEGRRDPLDSSTRASHVVLCGLGGLGKTSIAIEFAFARREKFDAVFWIRAEDRNKLAQGPMDDPQTTFKTLSNDARFRSHSVRVGTARSIRAR